VTENVIRFPDVERRSRNPAAVLRDLADSALIIILPVIRSLNARDPQMAPHAGDKRGSGEFVTLLGTRP
jgi:hypothetical protein